MLIIGGGTAGSKFGGGFEKSGSDEICGGRAAVVVAPPITPKFCEVAEFVPGGGVSDKGGGWLIGVDGGG